MGEREIPKVDK